VAVADPQLAASMVEHLLTKLQYALHVKRQNQTAYCNFVSIAPCLKSNTKLVSNRWRLAIRYVARSTRLYSASEHKRSPKLSASPPVNSTYQACYAAYEMRLQAKTATGDTGRRWRGLEPHSLCCKAGSIGQHTYMRTQGTYLYTGHA
jgi:hypothetical protein